MTMQTVAPGDTHTMTMLQVDPKRPGGFTEAEFRRNVAMAFPNIAHANGVVFGEIAYDETTGLDDRPLWRAQAVAAAP